MTFEQKCNLCKSVIRGKAHRTRREGRWLVICERCHREEVVNLDKMRRAEWHWRKYWTDPEFRERQLERNRLNRDKRRATA